MYKSKFTLVFKDDSFEEAYKEKTSQTIKSFKWIILILLVLSIASTIEISFFFKHHYDSLNFKIIAFTSYISTAIILVSTVLAFYSTNLKLLHWLNSINYILFFFVALNLRIPLLIYLNLNDYTYTIMTNVEMVVRLLWTVLFFNRFILVLILNSIIFLLSWMIYVWIQFDSQIYTSILIRANYSFEILIVIFAFYILEKRKKETFYYSFKFEEKSEWLQSILDNINSGYVSIKSFSNFYANECFNKLNLNKSSEVKEKSNEEDSIVESKDAFSITIRKLEFFLSQTNASRITEVICEILKKLKLNQDISQIVKDNRSILANYHNFNFIGHAKNDSENIEEYQVFELQFRFVENINELDFVLNDVSRTSILEKQKLQLELKYKNKFLSKIAHEFKNPLISITEKLNTAKDLIKELKPKEKHKLYKIFTFINCIGNFLILTVKDMDIISQSKKIQLSITDFDLEDLVDYCVNITDCLLELKDKKEKIVFKVIKDFPKNYKVHSDEWKVKQILINLLSNSIKFTTHGQIVLEVRLDSKKDDDLVDLVDLVRFSIQDTGRGISEEDKKDLFKENNKRNVSDNLIGAGLGLTIVQDLANSLNAIIDYESQIGQGTRFRLSILQKKINTYNFKNHVKNDSNALTVLSEFKPNDIKLHVDHMVLSENSLNSSSYCSVDKNESHENIRIPIIEDKSPIISFKKAEKDQMQFDLFSFGSSITKYIRHLKTHIIGETHFLVVVDDDKFTRLSNMRIIKDSARSLRINVEIFQAEDGIECLYIVYKCLNEGIKISMIFSDETMYYMRGTRSYEILNEILTAKGCYKIPFILVTAYEELLNNSSNSFKVVSKPLSKSQVEMALKLLFS